MNFGIMTGDAETRVLVRTGALPTSREAVASVRCSILQSGVILEGVEISDACLFAAPWALLWAAKSFFTSSYARGAKASYSHLLQVRIASHNIPLSCRSRKSCPLALPLSLKWMGSP